MKIGEVKVKETISDVMLFEAIELISGAYFNGNEYQPYVAPFAEKIAIIKYFLDGIEFDENESIYDAYGDPTVKNIVDKFYSDPRFSDSAKIMQTIRENVATKVEYKKDRLIHGAEAIENIADTLSEFRKFISDLDIAIQNISNMDFSNIDAEDIKQARKLIDKLNEANTKLDPKTFSEIIKDAADYKLDDAANEIIDSKNKQIDDLKQENADLRNKWSARNVLAFKKEDNS